MWKLLTPLKDFMYISAYRRVIVIPPCISVTAYSTLNDQNLKLNLHPFRRGSEKYCSDPK